MNKFTLLAGPCVIESEYMVMNLAEKIQKIAKKYDVDFYFKASFDKANRTSIDSYRGPGIDKGLRILENVKRTYGVKIVTDIHEAWQAVQVAEVADMLQIPAFLCRQTDLLTAAARTKRKINVKKAQFLAPWDMKNVVEKIEREGNKDIFICERGSMFGYNTLVVDMTSIFEMKKLGYPVLIDATHSIQKPGGEGNSTGGNREYVEYIAKAAIAAGADGVFLEVHENPDEARSDGPNMVKYDTLDGLIDKIVKVYNAVH